MISMQTSERHSSVRRRIIAISLVGALAVIVAMVALLSQPARRGMPIYQGKTAEEWLVQVASTNRESALSAIRKMGNQAIPVLIHAFKKVDTPWDKLWQWAYPKLPALLRTRLSPPVPAFVIRGSAFMVFLDSPKLEKAAFPELLRHLEDKSKGDQAQAYVMGVVLRLVIRLPSQDSTNAVPVVVPYLQANDPNMRRVAANVLEMIGPSAKAALPGLSVSLGDPDVRVRVSAACAVWRIDHQTNAAAAVFEKALATMDAGDFFVSTAGYLSTVSPDSPALLPAYIKALQAPKASYRIRYDEFRLDFIGRLAAYGRPAEPAVPVLVKILREDATLRSVALNALKRIDPEEAVKWETSATSSP